MKSDHLKNNLKAKYSQLTEEGIRAELEKLFYGKRDEPKNRRITIYFLGTKEEWDKLMQNAMKEELKRFAPHD